MNLLFELSSEACKIDVGDACKDFLRQSKLDTTRTLAAAAGNDISEPRGQEGGRGGGRGQEGDEEERGGKGILLSDEAALALHSLPLSVSQSMNMPHLSSAVKFGLRLLRGTLFSSAEARAMVPP